MLAVTVTDLVVESEEALAAYRSSEWAERCFCRTCGSNLFWRMADGSHVSVAYGAIENVEQLAFTVQIFVDEKPKGYSFADETKMMTGAEVAEAFSASGEKRE